MKINHLGITVTDVREASAFLAKHFGLTPIGRENRSLMHLQDDNGLVLSLFGAKAFSAPVTDPHSTHIGFVQATEEEVNEIYERLKADGLDVSPPERSHGWTFTFVAPGGFAIEVVC